MKNTDVLHFLRKESQRSVSGEEISRQLGVSRSAVWKEIQYLRNLGYEIEAQPHLGYRLAKVPDKLFADEIMLDLKTRFIGKTIFSYESLDSTNDTVMQLGKENLKEGVCVFTEHQKKGRGRLGRSWASPKAKNLLFSVLLRPSFLPSDVSKITLMVGVSAIKTIQKATGHTLSIKWPNDIVFQDKKVGGILTEMSAEADRVNFVVVGVGLNVNSSSKDLVENATSLKEIVGADISRIALAQTFLRELEKDYLRLKDGDFDKLAKEWEEFSALSGRQVTATLFNREVSGEALGIDQEGAFWIRKVNGIQEKIMAGDIKLFRASTKNLSGKNKK